MIKNRFAALAIIIVIYILAAFAGIKAYDFFEYDYPYWSVQPAVITGNTLMFLFVSIPMADKRQSRKPGFKEYKKATRLL